MKISSTAKFATISTLFAVGLLAVVAIFNAVVDPFGMNLFFQSSSFNAYKPEIYTRVRLFKAYEVKRVRPQTLILGTSRSHIGFSCSHDVWAQMEGTCYNMAFDGATSREMYMYLRHAYALRPLKHVLLGLEPYHLAPYLSTVRPDYDPHVLHNPNGDTLPRWITGDLRILTSLDTLKASVKTLLAQDTPDPSWFSPDGQRIGEVFFRKIDERFNTLSPRGYFHMTNEHEVGYQTEWIVAAKNKQPKLRLESPTAPKETSLAYVQRIVEFCRKHHIDLRIIITPAHVHHLEIMAAIGNWNEVEKKKRNLLGLVNEVNARYPDQPPTPIFDFSGYSSITEEAPPMTGMRSEMRYYWDSSHFKQIVGDYVLNRVYGVFTAAYPELADFGVQLTDATIEPYFTHQRLRQANYRRLFQNDVDILHNLVSNALNNEHS